MKSKDKPEIYVLKKNGWFHEFFFFVTRDCKYFGILLYYESFPTL